MILETDAPDNKRELFTGWETRPITDQINKKFEGKGFDIPGITAYYIPANTQEYTELSQFLGKILDSLPFNDEVGSTILMRNDASSVVASLSDVLHGKKTWENIQSIFKEGGEVFKNEVYSSHNLQSAMCYNIDLSVYPHSPENNGVVIQRINIVNENGAIRGAYDGDFDINQNRIIVTADNFPLQRVRTEEDY